MTDDNRLIDGFSSVSRARLETFRQKHSPTDDLGEPQPLGARIFLHTVQPIAQNGPQCGLVATCMAYSGLLDKTPPSTGELLEIAQRMGISKKGELFSARWLFNLIEEAMPDLCPQLLPFPTAQEIISLLNDGGVLLIPYDCDRNHEPAEKSGETAHWCLVIGYVYFDASLTTDIWQGQQFTPEATDSFYVLAFHGKSKHLGVWNYDALRVSNSQLNRVVSGRSVEEFVIPPEGLIELKLKTISVTKRI